MITTCWSAKGGSGTTVVAATLGLLTTRSLLVDLAGDVEPTLGLANGDRPGALDWLHSDAPVAHLADLMMEVDADTQLIPQRRGVERTASSERWDHLGAWLRSWADEFGGSVVIDAGTGTPPSEVLRHGDRDLLVTRPCYLSLAAAQALDHRPTGVVLVNEPGRALTSRDVSGCLGVPVITRLPYDTAISRAVDSGLLSRRLPQQLRRAAQRVAV